MAGPRVDRRVRIDAPLDARLVREAERREVSVNYIINRAAEAWLAEHESERV